MSLFFLKPKKAPLLRLASWIALLALGTSCLQSKVIHLKKEVVFEKTAVWQWDSIHVYFDATRCLEKELESLAGFSKEHRVPVHTFKNRVAISDTVFLAWENPLRGYFETCACKDIDKRRAVIWREDLQAFRRKIKRERHRARRRRHKYKNFGYYFMDSPYEFMGRARGRVRKF